MFLTNSSNIFTWNLRQFYFKIKENIAEIF